MTSPESSATGRDSGFAPQGGDDTAANRVIFDLKLLAKHYAGIIASELDRRRISVRTLHRDGIISRRNGFRDRLANGNLFPQETEKLLDLLQLDPFRMIATFGVKDGIEAYNSALYENLSQTLAAFARIWNTRGSQLSGAIEPMRPALCSAMAERIYHQMVLHQQRIDMARDNSREVQSF